MIKKLLTLILLIATLCVNCNNYDDDLKLQEGSIEEIKVFRDSFEIKFSGEVDLEYVNRKNFIFTNRPMEMDFSIIQDENDDNTILKLTTETNFNKFDISNSITITDMNIIGGAGIIKEYTHEYKGFDYVDLRIKKKYGSGSNMQIESFKIIDSIDNLKICISEDFSDTQRKLVTDFIDFLKNNEYQKIKEFFNNYNGELYDYDNDGNILLAFSNEADSSYYDNISVLPKILLDQYIASNPKYADAPNHTDLIVFGYESLYYWSSCPDFDGLRAFCRAVLHELQHSITHNLLYKRYENTAEPYNSYIIYTFINEGISTLSEYLLYPEYNDFDELFSVDYNDISRNGYLSLIYWTSDTMSYIVSQFFMLYLYSHYTDKDNFISDLLYKYGVWDVKSLDNFLQTVYNKTFDEIYKNFLLALVLNEESGDYSFNGHMKKDLELPYTFSGMSSINIAPYNVLFMMYDVNEISYPDTKGDKVSYMSVYNNNSIVDFDEPFNMGNNGTLIPMYIDNSFYDYTFYQLNSTLTQQSGPGIESVSPPVSKRYNKKSKKNIDYAKLNYLNKLRLIEDKAYFDLQNDLRYFIQQQ